MFQSVEFVVTEIQRQKLKDGGEKVTMQMGAAHKQKMDFEAKVHFYAKKEH